jgi:hypothetical protein
MPLFVALVFVAALLLILAVRRGAAARRLVHLRLAQEQWAAAMDRERSRAA